MSDTESKYKTWVIIDDRVSNRNQAIAVAEKIMNNYELKQIKYNFWSWLPNSLLALKPIHIDKKLLQAWESEGLPDLIISSGRRTAAIASYLKIKSNNNLKIIQIMHPNLPTKQFDIIISPNHDKIKITDSNIIKVTGALSSITSQIQDGGKELRQNYPDLKKFVAVIIGGNTKKNTFTDQNATELARILSNIFENLPIPFFISFSRRTPNSVKQIIKNNLSSLPTIIYDPMEPNAKKNPYFGMLSEANYIVCTADSISMCSEAASTSKPLYIYCPDNFKSPKHLFFREELLKLRIAKILDISVVYFEKYKYIPLEEIERVRGKVVQKLFGTNPNLYN